MNANSRLRSLLGRLLPGFGRDSAAPREERGSALIISLMVMVILTMMGVTFLVLAEQENKISINSRDHAQALYAAEAAVNIGLTWFNDPTSSNLFKPADSQVNLTVRKGRVISNDWDNDQERAAGITDTDAVVNGSAGATYAGGTQGGAGTLFEKPYRGTFTNTFWGRRETPDILLCGSSTLDVDADGTADCNATMKVYMDKLNNALLMDTFLRNTDNNHKSKDFGQVEIEQIRVYRPPVDFTLHTRYGIATIEAVAIKKVRNQVVARRSVREVIQEIPFPGPGGAIETDGTIVFDGSSGVHWGAVVSASSDDDIDLGSSGTANFVDCAVARQTSARFGFHWTINPAAKDDLDQGPTTSPTSTYLTEALGITRNGSAISSGFGAPRIGDPWILFRARRNILVTPGPVQNTVQPFPFKTGTGPNNDPTYPDVKGNGPYEFDKSKSANWSHMFQKQIVRFPPIDYDTWKNIAQSGQQGMYYFKWVTGRDYKQDGIGQTLEFKDWLNTYKTGVFFFDTQDSTKPTANGSNLAPPVKWAANLYIQGFIYANSTAFDSTGAGGNDVHELNMPGEPFLDDGIDLRPVGGVTNGDNCICLRYDVDDAACVLGARPIHFPGCAATAVDGDDCPCGPTALATMDLNVALKESQTYRNGMWDSDLDNNGTSDANPPAPSATAWNRFTGTNDGGTAGNLTGGHGYNVGVLPGYPVGLRHSQGQAANDWKRDPRFLNDTDTDSLGGSDADRQPHEPFLNLNSLTTDSTVAGWAGNDHAVWVDYQAMDEPVEKDSDGNVTLRTTRARDATGALYGLQPHLNGVFYCEGAFTGSGNVKVYGSMLMKGGYASTGSLEIWFNEDLVKGKFPDPEWKLPRVFSTARDTE